MLKQNLHIKKLTSIFLIGIYLLIFSAFSFHSHNWFSPDHKIIEEQKQSIFHDISGFCFLNQVKTFSNDFSPEIHLDKIPVLQSDISIPEIFVFTQPLYNDNPLRAPPFCI